MSSDSEHIPKPSKRVRRISDTSESSDDSGPTRIFHKRRSNKVDSDGSSSNEDSDVQIPGISKRHCRRNRGDPIVDSSSESSCSSQIIDDGTTDTEWESDWDSIDESSDDEILVEKPKTSKRRKKREKSPDKAVRHSESDDSDGVREKCPICLAAFRDQEVGTPAVCDHCFCLTCLTEWSKNVNTCPVDRQEFLSIGVRQKFGGKISRNISVEPRENKSENDLENDATYCQICEQCDREDRMLLCDGCDLGYHMECLNPPMHQVPIEEWFCPRCSTNDQNLAESIEIDLDEVPDLMAEARLLGVTYGRTRTGVSRDRDTYDRFQHRQRLIPRTRQTERVRANIRARCTLSQILLPRPFDPDQPSTSSGFDSISENSRGRSPYTSSSISRSRRTNNVKTKRTKATTRKTRKGRKRKMNNDSETVIQEVRIKEINADGVEEEIVTYVKVKQQKNGTRKYKKRKKGKRKYGRRRRYCRTSTATVKDRLALSLGLIKRSKSTSYVGAKVKNQISVPSRTELSGARYRAGISGVNLFGDNLMLDYIPMGSDDEVTEESTGGTGLMVGVQRRNAPICTNRRRLALKGITCPRPLDEPVSTVDLLSSIISSQEMWHSKESKKNITLKADGTLLLPEDTSTSIETSMKQEKSIVEIKNELPSSGNSNNDPEISNNLGSTTINSSDIIQAPMYSSSRAGGVGNNGADNGGSFRGNYHDRGHHGHGNQDYGFRDAYGGGGRPNYGGPGPRGGFGHGDSRPPLDFSPNFDNRRRPPPPPGMPHFRNRPNFLQNRRGRGGFNQDRNQFRPVNLSQGPVFPQPNNFQGQNNLCNSPNLPISHLPPPLSSVQPEIFPEMNPPLPMPEAIAAPDSLSMMNESIPEESTATSQSESRLDGEECDIYCDIETPKKSSDEPTIPDNEGPVEEQRESMALLPPPDPPSDLLDYDERSDKESDGEDLVIDDTPKDPINPDESDNKTADKYDPFACADSDTNDSDPRETDETKQQKDDKVNSEIVSENFNTNNNPTPPPLAPPPTPPDFPLLTDNPTEDDVAMNSLTRLGAYDDDEEEEEMDDCPNFSIYSSETMDVARHTEQELAQQIGPLEPPPMPPDIPDDDDIIVADVQACDLSEIPEPIDPYVASLQKERQTLSKIPPKKISTDSRGKITFKIGNKFKLNNRLSSLYDELDDNVEVTLEQDKQQESKQKQQTSTSTISESITRVEKPQNDNLKVKIDESSVKKADDKVDKDQTNKEDVEGPSSSVVKSTVELVCDESSRDSDKSVNELNEKSTTPPRLEKSPRKSDDDDDDDTPEVHHDEELDLSHTPESATKVDFELEKEPTSRPSSRTDDKVTEASNWESDGAYTPCKDEMPVREKSVSTRKADAVSPFESGLEPITPPPKDRSTDDLDGRCGTPIEYAGLGTEAISETDEAINFEEELNLLNQRKEKEIEEGEITDSNKLSSRKHSDKSSDDDSNNRKKKKDKRKQVTEKNKENISSTDNQVAWKKVSKSTKERQYREKGKRFDSREKEFGGRDKSKYREKSKEKMKKKVKDSGDKKKEKRKELPRYDVRKIVADKPVRPRKDEYGRDVRDLSRSMSRSRSLIRTNKRSHSRELRLSRSYSPRMNSRSSRSWSRRLARSWSRNRQSPAHKRSVSRSRRKSPVRDRRSLSRRRSRSVQNRRSRRSLSNARQRRNQRRSISRKHRSRSRSWSPSRSRTRSRSRDGRAKEKSKKHNESRSRSKRRKRSRSKTPPRKTLSKTRGKKRTKRKLAAPVSNTSHTAVTRSRSRERSYSRDRNRSSRNWNKSSDKTIERGSFGVREREAATASWSAQWTPSWSRSRSRTPPIVNRSREHLIDSHDWSPSPSSLAVLGAPSALPPSSPPSQTSLGLANSSGHIGNDDGGTSPKNLTVILRNKDAIKSKKRREKRLKERKKSRESERRKLSNKRNRTPPPSKEVFASGDNILVSVCFNNENASGQVNSTNHLTDTIPLLTTTKRRHREPVPVEPAKKPKKDKSKDKRSKSPKINRRDKKRKSKAAEIAATKKPVAVIDLDQSPFREQTPSPRDVIVLSDDDQDDDDHNNNHNNNINNSNETINNSGNAGVNNTSSNVNNDGNVNNKSINLIDDEDDEDDENSGNIRVQEQQRRLSSSVQQHMQQQLQLLQAEQAKVQNQEEDSESHQDQLQKLIIQQRCLIVSELDFIAQGPKTPPEPQVKFSINKQPSNLRPAMLHPLFDGDDDEIERDDQTNTGNNPDDDKCISTASGEGTSNKSMNKDDQEAGDEDEDEGMEEDVENDIDDDEELEADGSRNEQEKQLEKEKMSAEDLLKLRISEDLESGKIGPNTPPEPPSSPMTSPDAYDPFDPTKSRSPTPNILEEPLSNDQKHESTGVTTKESVNEKPESEKPKVISMVTIKHAPSPATDTILSAGDSSKNMDNSKDCVVTSVNSYATINPVLATVAAAVQRSGIFNVNPPGFIVQRNLAQTNHISPSNQLKQRTNPQLSNLFIGKNLPMTLRAAKSTNRNMLSQNGSELPSETMEAIIDTSSPYSPGSSLSDGIFDPPSPTRNHHSPTRPSVQSNANIMKNSGNNLKTIRGNDNKKDAFDALFGSSPAKSGGKIRGKKAVKGMKKSTSNSKIGVRMDENQLQILDDLPSSAVEMQVKDKFLKKLNRQERVVEEVKLVLKPHYTKKHVTKEEYKDIMRKAVPKICHNRTGEINPKKIAQLVEAYVKRCRNNKRKGGVANAAKVSRPPKNPWS